MSARSERDSPGRLALERLVLIAPRDEMSAAVAVPEQPLERPLRVQPVRGLAGLVVGLPLAAQMLPPGVPDHCPVALDQRAESKDPASPWRPPLPGDLRPDLRAEPANSAGRERADQAWNKHQAERDGGLTVPAIATHRSGLVHR